MKKTLCLAGCILISLFCAIAAQGFESSPIGWASLTDGNVPFTITGGLGGDTVIVTDATSLRNYATSTLPYTILVSGTITMPRGTSSGNTPQTIVVQSNKTIVGIGSNPGVNGGFNISGQSNIIIRNLNIWYRDSVNQGDQDPWTDGITIQSGSLHIWVDHCNIFDSPDGLCDPTKQSNYLTLSWNKFYYTPDGNNLTHRNCCLVGSSDTDTADRGKLKETFHHNWWGTNCKERMPRVRFGKVHVFNNYYSNLQSGGYCQGVGEECQIKVENNYYDSVPLPWKDYHTGVWGKIGWNTGNVFAGSSVIPTTFPNDYNNIFVPPYSYTLDAGASVITNVQNGAGVDKLTPSPNPMTFSVAPYAVSSSSISMTASTATCADGVEYYFANITDPNHDSGWQPGTSYTDTSLSPGSYTYTVKTRNQTQTIFTGAASFPASAITIGGTDAEPPIPNPMAWVSVPTATGSTSITMTATTAADATGPVQYYFECTTDAGKSSSWQTSTTYAPSGLTPSTLYSFRVKARDSAPALNETGWSSTLSATTTDLTPVCVAVGTAVSGTGAITVAWPTHVAGDVALLFVESCGGQAATLSTPAGFAAVANSPQATGTGTAGTQITAYWCRATSSSMTSPVVGDPGDHVYGRIFTFRDVVATGDPWDVTAGGTKATASTTTTFGTVTTTVDNDLIVLAASRDNDSTSAAWSSWTNANLSSFAERSDGGTTSGNGGGIGVATGGKLTAGAIGSTTATVTSSVDGHITIALKPDISPPAAASSPIPSTGETNVSTTQNLSWTAGSGATSHDVYFGTAASPPFIGNQTTATYNTGTMAASTIYYWRIDEKNAGGTTAGTVWNFTTGLWGCTNSIASDADGDCQVDFFDFAVLSDSWTGNWLDMLQFAEDWLVCNRTPADQCWQ